MSAKASMRTESGQGGFALLVLLALVGAGTVGILLAVNHFVPPLSDISARVVDNLETVQRTATEAYVRSGAFPANVDALAAATGLPAAGDWRRDPWGITQDLDYRVLATGLRVRSRGPDHRLGTADDVQCTVPLEGLVRVRQRLHLRVIRAVYVANLQAKLEQAQPGSAKGPLRDAVRDHAIAQRSWLTATTVERAALTQRMNAAAAAVAAIQVTAGWSQPTKLTGTKGLMRRLGLPDAGAIDGLGRSLLLQATIAVLAAGSDRRGGTDDDM